MTPDDVDTDRWPDPPEPSEQRWAEVRDRIAANLPQPKGCGCGRGGWAVGIGAGVIAASAVALWFAWPTPPVLTPPTPPGVVQTSPDPLAEYDVLPVATAEDVMVSAVRGGGVGFGSINHPVPDAMPLAGMADVTVVRGPAAGEMCCPEPGGAAVYVMPGDR